MRMSIDVPAFQRLLGQAGVAAFIGGLGNGVIVGGFVSTISLCGVGAVFIFLAILRR